MDLSIVIPLPNERKGILPLDEGLAAVLSGLNQAFEFVFINDGSVDDSYAVLCRLAERDGQVKVINRQLNLRQPAAIPVGSNQAPERIIIPMDGVLQNDFGEPSGMRHVCNGRL